MAGERNIQTDTQTDPEWITVQEYADHYRVSVRSVMRWIAAGSVANVRRLGPAGRVVRIHRSELNSEIRLPDAA